MPRQGYRFAGTLTVIEPTVEQPRVVRSRSIWIVAAIAIVVGFAGWLLARRASPGPDPRFRPVRFTIQPPDNTAYGEGRVSPDGQWLAFIGIDSLGAKQLWVRRLDSLTARPLVHIEFTPIWSPDSRFIAFGQDGKLKRIEVTGGPPQTICDATLVVGGSWNRDGIIIFAAGRAGVSDLEILEVPAKGGIAKALTKLDPKRRESQHTFPVFLPDGRHFVYTIQSAKPENGGIYLGSLDFPNARNRLLADVSNAEYAPAAPGDKSGYLLFARSGVLMAQGFDTARLQLRGEPLSLDKIVPRASIPGGSFSASQDGLLLISAPLTGNQMTWFDRGGKRLGTIGDPGLFLYPAMSPDQQTVAADLTESVTFLPFVWLFPLRGPPTRFALSDSLRPLWSPDGKTIVWESVNTALYLKTVAGSENESLLLEAANNLPDDGRLPCDWSRDGRFLIYSQLDPGTGYDLWRLPLAGTRKPVLLLHGDSNEYCGALSPDGRWIAYASDESGVSEIYVSHLPQEGLVTGRKWQVSYQGGRWPKWRRDGNELLYLDKEKTLVSVHVKTGQSFEAGAPQSLFATGIHTPDARFDVTADGQRFLIPTEVRADGVPPTVILNWTNAVRIGH